jgi:hypothetical protein
MHKRIALKGVLKFTLKQLQHVSVYSPSSGSALFELALVTVVETMNQNTTISLVPNNAADIHQQGPGNICSHTTRLTTPMYFN